MTASSNPRIRVAAAIVRDDAIFLVRHEKDGKGYWMLPGGGVQWGEEMPAALRRELIEETGYEIEVGPLLLVKESIHPEGERHLVHIVLKATIVGGSPQPSQDPRVVEAAWIPMTDFPELNFRPDIQAQLVAALHASTAHFIGNSWID